MAVRSAAANSVDRMTSRLLLPFALLTLWMAGTAHASMSAYHALERYRALRGETSMEALIQIRSEGYGIHPGQWIFTRMQGSTILPADILTTSGGIRRGSTALALEGVPNHPRVLNFDILNLDSDGALRIARRKAKEEFFRIDRVDYLLRTDPLANVPAWNLILYDESKAKLGRIVINATTGAVLRHLHILDYEVVGIAKEGEIVETTPEPFVDRFSRSVDRWFKRTGETFSEDAERALSTAEEIAIGQRSSGTPTDPR